MFPFLSHSLSAVTAPPSLHRRTLHSMSSSPFHCEPGLCCALRKVILFSCSFCPFPFHHVHPAPYRCSSTTHFRAPEISLPPSLAALSMWLCPHVLCAGQCGQETPATNLPASSVLHIHPCRTLHRRVISHFPPILSG
ncbi:hypothetical protein EXIGLDRAFT_517270 [Exidia glandulosa HHB12029]|uniref:Uncharacterized protein n=1 Tax=Exidia glandulosa HHB12029 TaxID=1314781 RepID=A0A165J890_EXIGL|nr:hypothetical protein EXIGLDRAFT_517270 [Exidia glandulosa HHB12029]